MKNSRMRTLRKLNKKNLRKYSYLLEQLEKDKKKRGTLKNRKLWKQCYTILKILVKLVNLFHS